MATTGYTPAIARRRTDGDHIRQCRQLVEEVQREGVRADRLSDAGKPYTFNLKHTVVGNRADVYQTKLVSDIVPQLPGGAQGQAGTLTFSRKSLAAAAKVLMIASYDGPDGA